MEAGQALGLALASHIWGLHSTGTPVEAMDQGSGNLPEWSLSMAGGCLREPEGGGRRETKSCERV